MDFTDTPNVIVRGNVTVNHDFFKTWSPEMAWCLGVLYTDGYLYSKTTLDDRKTNKTVGLECCDEELILKFSKYLSSTYNIKRRVHNDRRKDSFRVAISSGVLYDSLIELGLTEKKSLTITFPDNVPLQYMPDYIRGLWDGDGSVLLRTINSRTYIRCVFASGSESFIKQLASELDMVLQSDVKITHCAGNTRIIELYNESAKELCNFIYHGNMKDAFLSRKFNNWISFKNIICS